MEIFAPGSILGAKSAMEFFLKLFKDTRGNLK
jgi:hypothetical protein